MSQSAKPPHLGSQCDWCSHPRLQRHAHRFSTGHAGSILDRYARRASTFDRKALLRHTCHVASWVALLPQASATSTDGVESHSPVSLLSEFLHLRGKGPLTPWLRGILMLVQERIREACTTTHAQHSCSYLDGSAHRQWLRLAQSMPRLSPDKSANVKKNKGLRSLNKRISQWGNASIEHKAILLQKLESRYTLALQELDWWKSLSVLRQAVAALAPPRLFVEQQFKPESMDRLHAEHLQAAAKQQKRIRSIVIETFKVLQNFENDARVDTIVRHALSLIEDFERRSGSITHAAASKQWCLLRKTLSITSEVKSLGTDIGMNALLNEFSRCTCPGGLQKQSPVDPGHRPVYDGNTGAGSTSVPKLKKHSKVPRSEKDLRSHFIRKAFRACGQEAAVVDVLQAIKQDQQLQMECQQLMSYRVKRKLSMRDELVWEHSVKTHIEKFYIWTGKIRKRQGSSGAPLKVYRMQPLPVTKDTR